MVPCSGSRVNTRFLGYCATVRGRVLLCVIALFGRRKKKREAVLGKKQERKQKLEQGRETPYDIS